MTTIISYLNNFSKAIFKNFGRNTNHELMPNVNLLAILMMGSLPDYSPQNYFQWKNTELA
jgi:hypothetical protein